MLSNEIILNSGCILMLLRAKKRQKMKDSLRVFVIESRSRIKWTERMAGIFFLRAFRPLSFSNSGIFGKHLPMPSIRIRLPA